MEFTLVESKKKGNLKKNMNSNSNSHSTNQSTTIKSTNTNQTNDTTQSMTQSQSSYEKKILTQEEMTDVLISKIRNNDNIDIKTKEINKRDPKSIY